MRHDDRHEAAGSLAGAPAASFTVKDVALACGLPQPVVAQLVPRTWTSAGWMYTADQLARAVEIGREFDARRS